MENMPQILYKYKPCNDFTRKILTDGVIYMPSISELNDPFEGSLPYVIRINGRQPESLNPDEWLKFYLEQTEKYYTNKTREEQITIAQDFANNPPLLDPSNVEIEEKKTIEEVKKRFGVFSLTTEKNNFLMWSHYANSHKGICIGFNTDILFDTVDGGLCSIIYSNDFPIKDLYIEDIYTEHSRIIGTKGEFWEYENEYRLTKIDGKKVYKMPLSGIEEIILGVWISQEDKADILNIIDTNIPHCKVYETQLSKTKFELELIQIREGKV